MFDTSIQIQSSRRKASFSSFFISSLLWIESLPSGMQFLLHWASHIQYLAILYWGMFQLALESNQTGFVSAIQDIVSILSFQSAVTPNISDTASTILTVVSYCYLLLFVILITAIFLKFRRHQQISRPLNACINFLMFFHFAIGFWIVNIILMNNFQSIEDNGTGLTDKTLALNIINLIVLFFNYLFGFACAFLSYDPLTTSNYLSSHTPSFQLSGFLLKAMLAPVIKIFSAQSFSGWYFVIVSLSMSLIRHYYLLGRFPYYHYKPMVVSVGFSSVSILVSLFSIVLLPLHQKVNVSTIMIIYSHILIIPFLIKVVTGHLRDLMLIYLSLENHKITSEGLTIKKFFALSYLTSTIDIKSEWVKRLRNQDLQLWGAVASTYNKKHGWNAFEIKAANKDDTQQEILTLKEHADSLRKDLLMQIVSRIKSNDRLRIILANWLSKENKTLHMAIANLSGVSDHHVIMKFISYKSSVKLQKKVEDIYKNKEEVLDIKSVIDQTVISNKFVKMIHLNSEAFLQFWETYKKTNFKIMDLLKKSREIEEEDAKIAKYWTRNIQHRKAFAGSLSTLFSVYQSLVRNAPYSAFQTVETYPPLIYNKKTLNEDELPLNATNLFGSRNIVISASMARDKLGKILYASHNITELIGWAQHDVVGSNVSTLIQPAYRELHTQIMLKHIENKFDPQRKSKLYQNIQTFVVNKEGKSLPCCIYLAMHPYIQHELVYIAILRVKAVNKFLAEKQEKLIHKNRFTSSTLRNNFTLKSRLIPMTLTSKTEFTTKKSILPEEKKSNLLDSSLHTTEKIGKDGTAFSIDLFTQKFDRQEDDDDGFTDIPNERPEQDYLDNLNKDSSNKHKKRKLKISKSDKDYDVMPDEDENGDEQETKKEDAKTKYSESKPLTGTISNIVSSPSPMLKKKFSHIAGMGAATSSNKGSSSKNYISKLEKSVYIVPKTPRIESLRWLLILFFILTSGLLIMFDFRNKNLLKVTGEGVEMLSDSAFRLYRIVDTARLTGFYPLAESGIMSPYRYVPLGLPDSRVAVAQYVATSNEELDNYNNQIRNALYVVNSGLQAQFYAEKIPVIELNNSGVLSESRTANSFDLCTDIVAAVSRALVTPYSELTWTNPDIVITLYSTHDNLLLASLDAITVLQTDIEQKLSNEADIVIAIAVLITFLSFLALLAFFWLVRLAVKNRNRIIDIFLRLDLHPIDMRISAVGKLCTAIEKDHMNTKALNANLNMNNFTGLQSKKDNAKSSSNIYKRKKTDSNGLNISILTMNIYAVFLNVLIFSAFYFVLALILSQNSAIIKKTNMMMDSDMNLYKIDFLFANVYSFIISNMSQTLYNRPITEVWDETFSELSQVQSDFANLLNPNEGVGNIPELEQIIKGSLCDAIYDPQNYTYCISTEGGALLDGVIGGTSLLLSVTQRIKETFQNSQRTLLDTFLILQDSELINLEFICEKYLFRAFEKIDEIIKGQVNSDLDKYKRRFATAVVIFIIAYIVSGLLLWWKIEDQFKVERSGWRKMIRMIPHQMVMSDKLLKDYLVNNSEGVLDSMKRSIHLM